MLQRIVSERRYDGLSLLHSQHVLTRLTYIKSAVTRNVSEKSINSILDYISTSKQMDLLQNFYETTLGALKETKNERLWFKTNLKLGKLYEEQQDYGKLQKILKELHKSCQTSEGKIHHLSSSPHPHSSCQELTINAKARNCSKSTPWKFRCTPCRRTPRSSSNCTNYLFTSKRLFLIH